MPTKVRIISPARVEKSLANRKQWGDYWVKQELEKEFRALGLVIDEANPDLCLYLWGYRVRNLPKNAYNVVWVYSHPDRVTSQNLGMFNKVFSDSASYVKKLRAMGYVNAELMLQATSKKPLVRPPKYDLIFVGNSRKMRGRRIIADLGDIPYNLKVWGRGWDVLLPPRFYGGRYVAYEKLNELYASTLVGLNDHHPDMAREGFVSPRVFDILASGGFVISDKTAGIEEIFGDTVPQYGTPEHLRELLDRYINHPEQRLELMQRGREIALSHTWRKRAEQILAAFEEA